VIRAVILDLDGTLVDTAEEIALALNETLARQLWLGWIADRRLSRDGGDDLS